MTSMPTNYTDKDRMTDMLMSQKQITGTYNTFTTECSTPEIRSAFMSLLAEEHQIQHDVFCEMQKRGWYQVQTAEAQKVQQTKQKFQAK